MEVGAVGAADAPSEPAGERSRHYLRLLLALLLPAALFDSYDSQLRALLLTQLKASFHVGTAAVGVANIPIGAGQFLAFFLVLRADRVGRRPILLWSILGYTVCTTLTAASWNLWSFAAFQFGAQVFVGAEFGVAVTLLAEEVPAAARGRYLGLLLLFSPAGAVLGGLLVAVGFLHNPLGWRAFFLLATVPLLVVAVARRRLEESRAYLAARRAPPARRSWREVVAGAVAVWRTEDRGRVLAVGVIAFLQGVPAAGLIGWWTYYAEHQRHLADGLAGAFFAAAALFSMVGYVACGRLMDRLGRRPTAVGYVLGAVACAVVTFQVADPWVMLPFLLGTAFFGVGVAPVLSAFATELFPTERRAQAGAWIRNGFGNTGSILGPTLVGVLGASGGLLGTVGNAATVIALVVLPAAAIVWWALPETARRDLASTGPLRPRSTSPGDGGRPGRRSTARGGAGSPR
ncbi:MFS transporter [Aciditerrimonas ferrireducens]|uniref:MFS transporter n=1 Tax=Aciditerrimonas ferrireducens TaxID=667306 RepID=UPI00200411FE|nr:MFS transporter [Aciditerrimonas ferrireducens]MCK4178138.1 MFS transporter [Aciditerrimonas ferrireducens]